MSLVKVRKAIEAGQLDPVAKEIALCMAGGRENVWAQFLGASIWDFIGELEGMTAERAIELRSNLQTYLKTCHLLKLGEEGTGHAEMRLKMLSVLSVDG